MHIFCNIFKFFWKALFKIAICNEPFFKSVDLSFYFLQIKAKMFQMGSKLTMRFISGSLSIRFFSFFTGSYTTRILQKPLLFFCFKFWILKTDWAQNNSIYLLLFWMVFLDKIGSLVKKLYRHFSWISRLQRHYEETVYFLGALTIGCLLTKNKKLREVVV